MIRRALPLALLLAAACGATRDDRQAIARIDDLIDRQHFEEAVQEAQDLCARRPEDAEAQEAHRRASAAFLLDAARRSTFAGDLDQALEHAERAAEIGGDFPLVQVWLSKTRSSLGRLWFERGLDLHAQGNLDGAALAYQRALYFEPDSMPAARSLAQVGLHQDYRAELGEDYYHEGVQSLSSYWLERARARFSYAGKYLGDDRPQRRGQQVDRLLAEQRLALAGELERKGLFAAAANEYRLALLLDPDLEGAREARERAQREAAARQRLILAEMDLLRGDFGRARERLTGAGASTELQTRAFEELLGRIEGGRLEELYRNARDRERDFRYEEAMAAYDRLLGEVDFYKDARTRRDTLGGYVREAERLWNLALSATDPDRRRAYLLQIEVFWPEYRDLPERLAALGRADGP